MAAKKQIAALCFVVLCCAGAYAAEVKTLHMPAKTPALATMAETLKQSFTPDPFAAFLGDIVAWPVPIAIAYVECGTENASYHKGKNLIVFCYELIARISEKMPKDPRIKALPAALQTRVLSGTLAAIFLHEAGHAMIDLFDLPALGREEDVADQLATYLMLKHDMVQGIVGSILFFSQDQKAFYVNTQSRMADEHSLNPQRAINIACWAYGKDPGRYAELASMAGLSNSRAPRCGDEYKQLEKAVTTLLGDRLLRR